MAETSIADTAAPNCPVPVSIGYLRTVCNERGHFLLTTEKKLHCSCRHPLGEVIQH